MPRRGLFALLLALLFIGGTAGIATATPRGAAPAPGISPPPQCFVVKDGALPTCELQPNGSWTVTYPTGGGNLDTGGSSSHTRRDVSLGIVIAAVIGIAVIVWRTWLAPRRTTSGAAPPRATATNAMPPASGRPTETYFPGGPEPVAPPPPLAPAPAPLPVQPPPAPIEPPRVVVPPFAPPPPVAPPPVAPPPVAVSEPVATESAATRLAALNTLLNQGQITRDEYEERRRVIVEGM
jgi:hypothetical protein